MNQYFTNLVLNDVKNFEGFSTVKNYGSGGGYYIYTASNLEYVILLSNYEFKILKSDDSDSSTVVETFTDLESAVDFIRGGLTLSQFPFIMSLDL